MEEKWGTEHSANVKSNIYCFQSLSYTWQENTQHHQKTSGFQVTTATDSLLNFSIVIGAITTS